MQYLKVKILCFIVLTSIYSSYAYTIGEVVVTGNALASPIKNNDKHKQENLDVAIPSDEVPEDIQSLEFNEQYETLEDRDGWIIGESEFSVNENSDENGDEIYTYPVKRSTANKWNELSFDEDRQKRSVNNGDDSKRKKIPKGKQKKAKALGQLLMSNVVNDIDASDEYVAEEDDYFSNSLDGEKMNWEDYRNEDGSTVLELIALNARHKTRMHRGHDGGHLYQQRNDHQEYHSEQDDHR